MIVVDFGTNLVDLGAILVVSFVFAEIYSRFKIRRFLSRAENALGAFSQGRKTKGSLFLGRVLIAFLSLLMAQDEEGKWHLSKLARTWGVRILGAVAELVQVRGPKGGAPGLGGLNLAGLDMDQLIGVGISMLPKKQQGIAAMLAGVGLPLLKQFAPSLLGGGKATPAAAASSSITPNPFLKDLPQ